LVLILTKSGNCLFTLNYM